MISNGLPGALEFEIDTLIDVARRTEKFGRLEYSFSELVKNCTKDTSGQGLPMIGGGYTTLTELAHPDCKAH